jgi:hypothetical protein
MIRVWIVFTPGRHHLDSAWSREVNAKRRARWLNSGESPQGLNLVQCVEVDSDTELWDFE